MTVRYTMGLIDMLVPFTAHLDLVVDALYSCWFVGTCWHISMAEKFQDVPRCSKMFQDVPRYPKMQYVGMEFLTCGRGTESSRVPPDFYCDLDALGSANCSCDG